jgi:hypothetical protein
MAPVIEWNLAVQLIFSDVDETIADLYVDAEPEMARALGQVLADRHTLVLISGQSADNIVRRVVRHISPSLRTQIVVASCSGAELWTFDEFGQRRDPPEYSLCDASLSDGQKAAWRRITQQLIGEFYLEPMPPMPIPEFKRTCGDNPLAIMLDDRGPQITLEFVNAWALSLEQINALTSQGVPLCGGSDLRIPFVARASELLTTEQIPITPRLAGVFAVDLAIEGVSKQTAVRHVMESPALLHSLGLSMDLVSDPRSIEVWGDKFSAVRGGTDRHISESLPSTVRSISVRDERPEEFSQGYNIVLWNGSRRLHEGLLEFLRTRYP